MKPLTIIQLLPELNGGGVERGTLEIAQALVHAGHRSIVISAGGRMVQELCDAGSEHITVPIHKKSLATLIQIWRLKSLFRALKPDIIHLRSRLPAWLAWLACKLLPESERPIIVTTVHGLNSVNRYSRIMTRGEAVIAVSNTVMDFIKTHYPENFGPHCQLIYRGIDTQIFQPGYQASEAWRKSWFEAYPMLQGEKVLCLPGRITRLKGHLDFIHMIAALRQNQHRVYGLIVGGEDPRRRRYFQEVQHRIAQLGLSDCIIFTGHRRDIREIYSVSDIIYSLSSKPESFGRTVLEPLAMGKPVIGYDHGGVGEILAALFPQGRVQLGNIDELIDTSVTQLASPVNPKPNTEFLLSEMTGKTLALYASLVQGKTSH